MSIRVMTQVWDTSRQKGSALLLLLKIADFADDGGHAFPALAKLCEKTRMSHRNVQYLLGDLQAAGELVIRKNKGRNGSNSYRVLTDEDKIAAAKAAFAAENPDYDRKRKERTRAGKARRGNCETDSATDQTGGANFAPPQTAAPPEHATGCTGAKFAPPQAAASEGCKPLHEEGASGCTQTVIEPSLNRQSINERANERVCEDLEKQASEADRTPAGPTPATEEPANGPEAATASDPQPSTLNPQPPAAPKPNTFEAWRRDEARLPAIPLDVWTCEERKLLPLLTAWRDEHGLCDWLPVAERTALLGAVLAARHAQRSDPERYARACLRRGVQPGWIAAACKLNEKYRRSPSYAPG